PPATTPFITLSGCSTPGGSDSGGVSGGAKQNTSVLQIGLAPRPVPSGSRITPPSPVLAPPYGSIADGWLCVSTLKQTLYLSSKRTTPALSSKTLTHQSSAPRRRRISCVAPKMVSFSRLSMRRPSKSICPLSVLCEQCSDQVWASVSNSMSVGSRPSSRKCC